jgi:hypothetical protein
MIINLREHLRIHKASMKRIIQGLGNKVEATITPSAKHTKSLLVRLDDALQLLEYYEVTACSLLDQQQNLLSLVRYSSLFSLTRCLMNLLTSGL